MSAIRHRNNRPLLGVVLGLLILLAAAGAWAQSGVRDWNNQGDPLQGALGLHYGRVGGHGLAFRVPLQWWLYLQTAGGIWHTEDHKRHNLGVELNYILRQDDRVRLYVGGGLCYFYDKEKTVSSAQGDTWEKETNWNVGLGIGLEFLQGKRWSWQIEANFAHMGDSGDITITPQAGLYYYW